MGVFKPNTQNIQTVVLAYQSYSSDSNQILHNPRLQVLFVGGPKMRPTNPRWLTAVTVKIAESDRPTCISATV